MKGFKKLLTGILAATMIMGASLTAFAAEDTAPKTVSITIENDLAEGADGVKKIDYTYYQFLKAEVLELDNDDAEQKGKAVYYVENEALATALANTNLFTSTKAQAANRWYIAAVKGVTADQIVAALNTPDMKKLAISSDTFSSDEDRKAVMGGLEPGYYLVLSSLGTKAALQTLGDVVIKEKNEDTTVTKKENIDVDAMYDHQVEYTITINVPESPAEQPIKVVDTATVGLTLDETVKVNDKEYDWARWTKGEVKVNAETQKSEVEYTLSIPKEVVTDNAGGTIVLTYGAEINKNAKVYVEEENRAYIVYDNNKSAETVPVKVKTLGIKIIKFTKVDNSEKRLTGAEFTLWRADKAGNQTQVALVKEKLADGNEGYRVAKAGEATVEHIVVDENGEALVAGLDADYMYYLQEEVAPEGYTMLSERFPVEMDTEKTAYQEVKVENKSGVTLPSTGGIGTTIFYIVGGILIVAGIAYFIVRRKANAQ